MKVWIVHDGGHDFSDATKFGEVSFIFKQRYYPFGDIKLLEQVFDDTPVQAEDYLILSGPVVLNAVCAALWLERFGYINLLMFNAKTGSYVEKTWNRQRN